MNNLDNQKGGSHLKVNQSRRRLAKTAAITPVFMTLLNRPAWGGARSLCSVAGFDSAMIQNAGNFSFPVVENEICGSVHPEGYWLANPPSPSDFDITTETFNRHFGTTLPDDPTFEFVLKGGTTKIDSRFAGLFLDQRDMGVSPFGEASVARVYLGLTSAGSYTFPGSGIEWFPEDFNKFFDYILGHAV